MATAYKEYVHKLKNAFFKSWRVKEDTNTVFTIQHSQHPRCITYTLENEATHYLRSLHSSFFVIRTDSDNFCYYAAILPIQNHGYVNVLIWVKDDDEQIPLWKSDLELRDTNGYVTDFPQESSIDPHMLYAAGDLLKDYLVSLPQYRLLRVTGLIQ